MQPAHLHKESKNQRIKESKKKLAGIGEPMVLTFGGLAIIEIQNFAQEISS
jgi:hypothetical protein